MKDSSQELARYYRDIKSIILHKQNAITGLLPASTSITKHGNYTDAWVRDNVYSILAVWGLSIAMRDRKEFRNEQFELEQATIALMRGLLRSMMLQSDKVEHFKHSLSLQDALHAKYDTATGDTIVGDHAWGHLQIDATSLFMLMLAQMIDSGLPIIVNLAEVDFVQNLVYYIERAYRTPDYGIWERGEKSNVGYVELNASSIGMAKAALKALAGFDLMRPYGSPNSCIHVQPDNVALAEVTLQSLLPRESVTKEIDAALLSVIGYPAFAVTNPDLKQTVHQTIREKLAGKYGYKRFLRDGHQTVLEDNTRHYYNEEELKRFENIECEWPLFLSYEFLMAHFDGDIPLAEQFRNQIHRVMQKQKGHHLLPELYIVPQENIAAEKENPHTQTRIPNENIPLVWAQSLYYLGAMLYDGLLTKEQLDPLGLHLHEKQDQPPVQVLLLAENTEIQEKLAREGIVTQSISDLPRNVIVCLPDQIAKFYHLIGKNEKLSLTGRPMRRLKSLSTSRIFRYHGNIGVCLSLFFLEREFYLTFDPQFLVERFKDELAYIYRYWPYEEKPLVSILFTESLVAQGIDDYVHMYKLLTSGQVDDVPTVCGTFEELSRYGRQENLDEILDISIDKLHENLKVASKGLLTCTEDSQPLENEREMDIEAEEDLEKLISQLLNSTNLFEQIRILDNMILAQGLDFEIELPKGTYSLKEVTEEVYQRAGRLRLWSVVRHAAALLKKVDVDLESSVTSLLAHQKIIQVGKAFSDESLIVRPIPFSVLIEKLDKFCRDDKRDVVLTQELLVQLGILIGSHSELFQDMITVRVSYIILLLTGLIARQEDITQEEALEKLLSLPPSSIQALLIETLEKYKSAGITLQQLESMHAVGTDEAPLSWTSSPSAETEIPDEGWLLWRRSQGTLHKAEAHFFSQLRNIFKQSKGLIIGDKLDRRNRLESRIILSDMTPGEKAFELKVEYLLNKIQAPEYRQITMEAMMVLAHLAKQNPHVYIDDYVVIDIINGHAVRLAFTENFLDPKENYQDKKAQAWNYFYSLSPGESKDYIAKSVLFLVDAQETA